MGLHVVAGILVPFRRHARRIGIPVGAVAKFGQHPFVILHIAGEGADCISQTVSRFAAPIAQVLEFVSFAVNLFLVCRKVVKQIGKPYQLLQGHPVAFANEFGSLVDRGQLADVTRRRAVERGAVDEFFEPPIGCVEGLAEFLSSILVGRWIVAKIGVCVSVMNRPYHFLKRRSRAAYGIMPVQPIVSHSLSVTTIGKLRKRLLGHAGRFHRIPCEEGRYAQRGT